MIGDIIRAETITVNKSVSWSLENELANILMLIQLIFNKNTKFTIVPGS